MTSRSSPSARAESVTLLREYLRIDTSNPPGNEEAAARFLGRLLEREGIATEYVEAAPGRVSLRAVLRGRGERRPLILLNHTDVVPAQAAFWEEPPFAGVLKHGEIWGRGALDMKSMAILELLVLLLFRRHGLQPARDLVFLAVADEETGGSLGIEFLDRQYRHWITEAEYCLNEGGLAMRQFLGSQRPVFACSPAEKGPLWVRLRAQGRPGHGAIPHADNAVERLVRALERLLTWEQGLSVPPLLHTMLDRMRRGRAWGGAAPSPTELCAAYPNFRAMVTNTVALTSLGGGVTHNVIPALAEATLDCRLLPGESSAAFLRHLRGVINDGQVEIEVVFQSESRTSDFQTELVRVVQAVVQEQAEGALVLPVPSVGFTDSRVFRRHGVHAYGFVPTLVEASLAATVHGHNERIPVESLHTGLPILFEVVRRICA